MAHFAKPPIAIGFLNQVPDNLPLWSRGMVPAGCQFWQAAWSGETFYTVPEQHQECAVGAHTHHIALPAERAGELPATIGFMVSKGYLEEREVPSIAVWPEAPAAIAYGPAGGDRFGASVVVCTVRPVEAMVLFEAMLAAGVAAGTLPALGRPACSAVPFSANTNGAALSFGCKGNRTFTGLADDELYIVMPAAAYPAVEAKLETVGMANAAMGEHYASQRARFPILA